MTELNFYPFNTGDYAGATRHLDWTEDLAYRRMLDAYYIREAPLPLERRAIYRLVIASLPEQREAVDTVLVEFFREAEDGWHHDRCDEEIAKAQTKKSKAAQSANARWHAPEMRGALPTHCERIANASESDANASKTVCEGNAPNPNPNPNKEPPTGVQGDKPPRVPAAQFEKPDWVPAEPWAEFVAMRKAKGQRAPFTLGAAKRVVDELAKLMREGNDPAAVLVQSVVNGWAGVFPIKSGATVVPLNLNPARSV